VGISIVLLVSEQILMIGVRSLILPNDCVDGGWDNWIIEGLHTVESTKVVVVPVVACKKTYILGQG
jgi:hypothetical protein